MRDTALQTTGDGRPDWRAIASPALFGNLVSRGQTLVAGLLERLPPSESAGPRPH